MKIYVASLIKGDTVVYGMTIYSNSGELLLKQSANGRRRKSEKFSDCLNCIRWCISKIKKFEHAGVISKHDDIMLFMNNKTVHSWFIKGLAPEPYTVALGDILFEAVFLLNKLEVIYDISSASKVIFTSDVDQSMHKASELFSQEEI